MSEKKNPHQKTINALCRKLDKLDAKASVLNAERGELCGAIRALGGDPGDGNIPIGKTNVLLAAAEAAE